MTYTIIVCLTRRSDLTPEEFRDYYEHNHLPLVRTLLGPCWPKHFTRRYLARTSRKGFGGPDNPDSPPLMLRGVLHELDCDCIAEISFASEPRFQDFYKRIYEKDAAASLAADELMFLTPEKTRAIVVGETWTTDEHGEVTREIGCV